VKKQTSAKKVRRDAEPKVVDVSSDDLVNFYRMPDSDRRETAKTVI